MTHTDGSIEYDKTTSVHAMTLIREVRKYEVLYNKQLLEYTDLPKKEEIWERIHQALFPNYEALSEKTRSVIKRTVRKRWKSLRDAVVKDQRVRSENPALGSIKARKQNPLVKEMGFLLPYIKTPRYKTYYMDHNDSFDDGNHSPDFQKLLNDNTSIDLTFQDETNDVKADDDDEDDDDDLISSDALYPSVRLTTSESESGEVEWRNGYFVSTAAPDTARQPADYTEPPPLPPPPPPPPPPPVTTKSEPDTENSFYSPYKRKRSDSETDLQAKIVELVERCNNESQDEDRMFLLSLLSDFKRVPLNKKLKVKSAFVTALSDALG